MRETLDAGSTWAQLPALGLVAALSIAGVPPTISLWRASCPRTASRRNELKALARERRTIVFFEAARRLGPALINMAAIFGEGRQAAMVRDIGEVDEEVVRARLGELATRLPQIRRAARSP